ncbi:hypothetical protein SAMN05444397_1191 [Flavobacterium aquidurense]|nr:hypothetical protein SAMN05444397_1191 [Flavobacterium aquidurense]
MKIKITLLVLIVFTLFVNAQIYTPIGAIQGTSGNNFVGIGTTAPTNKLEVYGGHGDSRILLHSTGGTSDVNQADLMLWASEPGLTYSGVGIGNNIHNFNNVSGGLHLLNPARGGSYLRLLDNFLSLNIVSSSGIDIQAIKVNSDGNVSLGAENVGVQTKLHVKESGTSNNIWRGRIVSSGDLNAVVIGENNGKSCLGAHNSQLNAWSDLIIQGGGGNVGIGVFNPINKLDVNGTIHSKEVKVDMNGWSDFVFKKEYNLPTLQEVEKYIKERGHLENIPSEEEVSKNGINLGEMNSKLLQQIEEMVLYMIEQNKQILDQKSEMDKLKNENKNFKLIFERLSKIEEKLK